MCRVELGKKSSNRQFKEVKSHPVDRLKSNAVDRVTVESLARLKVTKAESPAR